MPPLVLETDAAWTFRDLFTPLASIQAAADTDAAVAMANAGPYALGAAVFGPYADALRVAHALRAGCGSRRNAS